jgi:hypothetical protein
MTRLTSSSILLLLLVTVAGCGRESPTGPSFARPTAPAAGAAFGAPLDEAPVSGDVFGGDAGDGGEATIGDDLTEPEPEPVTAGKPKKRKKPHPVHPVFGS